MFVVPLDLAAVMHASCAAALVPVERRKLVELLEGAGVADDVDAWIDHAGAATSAALRRQRTDARQPTDEGRPRSRPPARAWPSASGTRGPIGVSTRLLFLMSTEGQVARARPLGSWISSQYRWVPMADWIGDCR